MVRFIVHSSHFDVFIFAKCEWLYSGYTSLSFILIAGHQL